MKSISVIDFIQQYKVECENAIIYKIKDSNCLLYIGKSEGISGVVGRLDNHLWLNRRANGNYILINLPKENDSQTSIELSGYIKEKQLKGSEMLLKVWTSGIDELVSLYLRKFFYWSTPDKLGRYILERVPKSLDWTIEFYDIEDLGGFLVSKRKSSITKFDVLQAEKKLIRTLKPLLNYQHI